MKINSKSLFFWFFSVLAVLVITIVIYRSLMTKSLSNQPHLSHIPPSHPLDSYSQYLKQFPSEQPPSSASLHELYKTPHTLRSSRYSEGGNWRFLTEGFLERDLKDFIRWLEKDYSTIDPLLLSQKQRISLFKKYLNFMQSSDWLTWLESDKSKTKKRPEDLELWARFWEMFPAVTKKEIHQQALEIKKYHLTHSPNPSQEIQSRTQGLFIKDDSGALHNRVPVSSFYQYSKNDQRSKPSYPSSGAERYQNVRDFLKKNGIFITISLIVIGSLASIVARVLKNLRT